MYSSLPPFKVEITVVGCGFWRFYGGSFDSKSSELWRRAVLW